MKGKLRQTHRATSILGRVLLPKMSSKRIEVSKVWGLAVRAWNGGQLVVALQRIRSLELWCKVVGESRKEKKIKLDVQRRSWKNKTESWSKGCDSHRESYNPPWWWRWHWAATYKTIPAASAGPTWSSVPKNKIKRTLEKVSKVFIWKPHSLCLPLVLDSQSSPLALASAMAAALDASSSVFLNWWH